MVLRIDTTDAALDEAFRYVASEIIKKANALITGRGSPTKTNSIVTENQ